ncbi:MAG: alpha/beta hydrolase fold protein [Candidatus Eremiobacteraeota bacterium]|nr:alpha/beta hydrolase fold protein [Candidatus Eremiobacteraeota bacterium]
MTGAAVPFAWRSCRIGAGGATLAAYEAGSDASDAPVALLLHGLGHWTDGAWGRVIPHLDPAIRYVAFDLPGFGESDKPAVRYNRAYFRRVVDDVADALGLSRFALVGHSLGGLIAADWAGTHPERVTHLALIAPAAFARSPRHVVFALVGNLTRRVTPPRPSRRFVLRALEGGVADPTVLDPADVERAYALSADAGLRRAFTGVYASAVEAFGGSRELRAGFARYGGPLLCAWGRHDRYIPVTALRGVQRVYPHAQTLILERSGHLPMIEQPQELAAVLRTFLRS